MKHTQATISEHPINNVEMVSRQVLPKQLVDIFEPSLTANLKVSASDQLIEILLRIPMTKGGRSKNNPIHGSIVASAIRTGKLPSIGIDG